jgi:hypothetical protein
MGTYAAGWPGDLLSRFITEARQAAGGWVRGLPTTEEIEMAETALRQRVFDINRETFLNPKLERTN